VAVLPDKQWHPLFVTAVREALSDALSSKPVELGVLVVKTDRRTGLSPE
jgi:hypothetical protein